MTETIGADPAFQIECTHEPFPGSQESVFGRMCVRFGDRIMGDFDEPACMLDVTANFFDIALKRISDHAEPELCALSDEALWQRLNALIYLDDRRTAEQVYADAVRYSRFDFLTGGGESFDKVKCFFVARADDVRVLFQNGDQPIRSATVARSVFVETLQAWLQWFDREQERSKHL